MANFNETINIATRARAEMVDITNEVQAFVRKTRLGNGTCRVFVPHTTAGVTINENADPDVCRDILHTLDLLVPRKGDYSHSEGNSAAHVKAVLTGSSAQVLIVDSQIKLGTWQGIFLCEFDGPRSRQVWLAATGEPVPFA